MVRVAALRCNNKNKLCSGVRHCVTPPIRMGNKKSVSLIEHFFVDAIKQFRAGSVPAVRAFHSLTLYNFIEWPFH